ncbi:MAG: biopolymer transporter ExbD [Rhizobiaceae bacterium]|nr:biopolymer transporter ExbD [Rhizobiaceae bacterium]
MRIDTPIRRGRRLSLTSLIDVIFLLLLFFMLSSTFTKYSEVEITGGSSGFNASSLRPDIMINLTKAGWRINGVQISNETSELELMRLATLGAKTAVILIRDEVSSQMLVSAVETVRKTGLKISVGR